MLLMIFFPNYVSFFKNEFKFFHADFKLNHLVGADGLEFFRCTYKLQKLSTKQRL